ncbi:hypothetical protein EGT56_01695 [Arachnia propionica]|nr:hypothetical protein EGT56_01695 [Arachnia propionica]
MKPAPARGFQNSTVVRRRRALSTSDEVRPATSKSSSSRTRMVSRSSGPTSVAKPRRRSKAGAYSPWITSRSAASSWAATSFGRSAAAFTTAAPSKDAERSRSAAWARPAVASGSPGVAASRMSNSATARAKSPAASAASAFSKRGSVAGSAALSGAADPVGWARPVMPLATASCDTWSRTAEMSARSRVPWKSGAT